jgi:hypothetical protein
VWPDIEMKPVELREEKWVVCIDSLGQDREFSEEEKQFAYQTIDSFKETWEKLEKDSLIKDRDRKLK